VNEMAGMSKAQAHQHQRNKEKRKTRLLSQVTECNKAKKLAKHLVKFPLDMCAHKALSNIPSAVLSRMKIKITDVKKSEIDVSNKEELIYA
jgi:hypothetical protein